VFGTRACCTIPGRSAPACGNDAMALTDEFALFVAHVKGRLFYAQASCTLVPSPCPAATAVFTAARHPPAGMMRWP
jgi:hypothetical protein